LIKMKYGSHQFIGDVYYIYWRWKTTYWS
jgi:hypothetical protein